MGKSAPIKVIMYYPETEKGKEELKDRVIEIFSDFVKKKIQGMDCPDEDKMKLLDCIIKKVSDQVI